MTTTHEMDAYLGDFRDDLLALRGQDGYDALMRVDARIRARYPKDETARENALSAAAQVAYGDATLEVLVAEWKAAQDAERAAMAAVTGAMLWAHETGSSKVKIARVADVARMTVDRAVGRA